MAYLGFWFWGRHLDRRHTQILRGTKISDKISVCELGAVVISSSSKQTIFDYKAFLLVPAPCLASIRHFVSCI